MAGLEDLYREIILDHYKNPRLKGELPPPAHRTQGFNPLCGDEVVITVDVKDGVVTDLRVTGQGCSISQSSASMMAAAVQGRSVDEVDRVTHAFKTLLTVHEADGDGQPAEPVELGELEALRGVVKFPSRIKCATLAWNTLGQALDEVSSAPAG
jgi:nitrogen fixation protein NifU and related proteins